MRDRATTLVVALIGGLAGALAMRLMSPPPVASPPDHEVRFLVQEGVSAPRPALTEPDGGMVIAGGWRLPTVPSTGDPSDEPAAEAERIREESVTRHRAAFAELLARHDDEPIDPTWSRESEYSFGEQLRGIGTLTGTDVRDVDCRSTTCTATLGWESYGRAQEAIDDLLGGQFVPNCARSIRIEPPDDPALPLETRFVLHCDE
jgi:hypothetical protein